MVIIYAIVYGPGTKFTRVPGKIHAIQLVKIQPDEGLATTWGHL